MTRGKATGWDSLMLRYRQRKRGVGGAISQSPDEKNHKISINSQGMVQSRLMIANDHPMERKEGWTDSLSSRLGRRRGKPLQIPASICLLIPELSKPMAEVLSRQQPDLAEKRIYVSGIFLLLALNP